MGLRAVCLLNIKIDFRRSKMAWDYKCVAVPETIDTGKSGKGDHSAAVTAYEQIIKNAAQGGWELDHIDTVNSYQTPGCCAALIGKIPIIGPLCCGRNAEAQLIIYKMLIFRKAQ
jgi:hypothetical protein